MKAPIFLAALFSILLLASPAVAQPAPADIPLKIVSGKTVVDRVFLNGQGPYRFLLDTGSQSNLVDSDLARRLGLQATLHMELFTPSGASTVHGTRIPQVTLGTVEAKDQEFIFTDFRKILTLPSDMRGILGQEFLSHFDYLLDLQHHRLTFGAVPASGTPVRFRPILTRMAVHTSLGDLILDSGAEMLFLYRGSTQPESAEMIGATGMRTAVSITSAPDLRIGDRRYSLLQAAYQRAPAAEEAGLLPVNLFHAIFVCNSQGYVVFDPFH